jgi:hypothetical protein
VPLLARLAVLEVQVDTVLGSLEQILIDPNGLSNDLGDRLLAGGPLQLGELGVGILGSQKVNRVLSVPLDRGDIQ